MTNESVYVTPSGLKEKLKQFIESNKILEKKGLLKNAINFQGLPGIAKTSSVIQFCNDNGIGFEKVNMGTIDDLGEITGFPMKEFQLSKEGDIVWVNDKSFDIYVGLGYKPTGETRTGYAEPKWVSNLKKYETGILLLDDSFRCHQRFMNALMELINRGEYYGWKLPKGCNIVMTNNPEGDEFQRLITDSAQSSRFMTFDVKYDTKDWAEQAEKEEVPGEFINFIIQNSDQIFAYRDNADKNKGMNSMPRQWTMFFNSLLNLKGDYTSKSALFQIQQNGKSILRSDYVTMFTMFLQSPDWNLIDPSEVFDKKISDETIINKLKECVGEMSKKTFKPAQSAVLSMRVVNHIIAKTVDEPLTDIMVDRLQLVLEHKIFGEDLILKMLRDLFSNDKKKFAKLFQKEFFRNAFLK